VLETAIRACLRELIAILLLSDFMTVGFKPVDPRDPTKNWLGLLAGWLWLGGDDVDALNCCEEPAVD
jgi:hypothetical protein